MTEHFTKLKGRMMKKIEWDESMEHLYISNALQEKNPEKNENYFPYFFGIHITEGEYDSEYGEYGSQKFYLTLGITTPARWTENRKGFKKKIAEVLSTFGMENDNWNEMSLELKAQLLFEMGWYCRVKDIVCYEEDLEFCIEKMKAECPMVDMMFGFYMDKAMNALGASGWDWCNGDIGI